MAPLYQIHGLPEVKRFLGTAVLRARDPRPALKFVGEELLVRNQRRVRSGVDVEGKPIKRSGRVERSGGQTNLQTGRYMASWHYETPRPNTLDYFSSDKRAGVLRGDVKEILPKNGQFLTIPIRGRGGMFAAGGVDVTANRTGAKAGHYKDTFILARGMRRFIMQRTSKGALRALFLLVRSVHPPERDVPGIGSSDVEMAGEKVANYVTGGKG